MENINLEQLGAFAAAMGVTLLYSAWFRSDMTRLLNEANERAEALRRQLAEAQQRHERQLIDCYAPPIAAPRVPPAAHE
jgi:hypothetical protein